MRLRWRRAVARIVTIVVLAAVVTAVSFVQPTARFEAEQVPISELIGSLPAYPEPTIIIDENARTFTLLDQHATPRYKAAYADPLVDSYMAYIAQAGAVVEVRARKSDPLLGVALAITGIVAVTALGAAYFALSASGVSARRKPRSSPSP